MPPHIARPIFLFVALTLLTFLVCLGFSQAFLSVGGSAGEHRELNADIFMVGFLFVAVLFVATLGRPLWDWMLAPKRAAESKAQDAIAAEIEDLHDWRDPEERARVGAELDRE